MDIIELLDQPEPEQEKALPPISVRALISTLLIVVVVGAVLWGWVARDSRAWDESKSKYEEAIAVAEAKQEQDATAAVQEVEEALQVLEQEAHHSTKLLKQVGDELDDQQASADLDSAITSARDMIASGVRTDVDVLVVEAIERRVLLGTKRLERKEFEVVSGTSPAVSEIMEMSDRLDRSSEALRAAHVQWGKKMLSTQVDVSEKVLKKSKKKVDDEKTRTALTKLLTGARDALRSDNPSVAGMKDLTEEMREATKDVRASQEAKKESDKAKAANEKKDAPSTPPTQPQAPSVPTPTAHHPSPPSHTRPPTGPQRADVSTVRHLISQRGSTVVTSCSRVVASSSVSTMPAAEKFVARYPKVRQFAVNHTGTGVSVSACASR